MTGILQSGRAPLILASTSKTRARILESAGLAFTAEAPGLDEATMREAASGEQALGPHDVAEILARAKAEAVSDVAPGAFVIGADQVLALEDEIISKPPNMEAARKQLLNLNGKTHQLHTAVAVATDGEAKWALTEVATLTMRKLSPEFIGHYLAAAGDKVLASVGAYQIESIGIQLFENIEGDFFSILGLPLLPLLEELRREGVIEA
jgi:septum formation protein